MDSEKLTPGDDIELVVDKEGFPLTVEQISTLMDSKSTQLLEQLGGINMVALALKTDLKNGLSEEEQKTDFAARRAVYGKNVYRQPPPKNFFVLLWEAITETIVLILIGAAVVSIILGVIPLGGADEKEWLDGVAILAAVIVIALVSSINNYNKDRQFRRLNKSRTDQQVKVIRGGKEIQVNVTEVNVGDVIVLEQGDSIPADGLYIEGFNCNADESNMTGESDAIPKNEEKPFMISGCTIAEGSCHMLALRVGSNSEWGKTLEQLQGGEEPETPLQKKLKQLAYLIGIVGLFAAVLTFVILFIYWIANDVANKPWDWAQLRTLVRIFIIGVTIIVVAVPEGLPLAVTISLAYSMQEMLKDKNLVRHLDACETMGGATNICSDKTGTLTENRMTVVQGMLANKTFKEVPPRELPKKEVLELIIDSICINSKAAINEEEGKPIEFIGNKTECALLVFAKKLGYDYVKIRADTKSSIKTVYNFSSARKRMSTVVKIDPKQSKNKKFRIFTKGASEIILKRCSKWIDSEGNIHELDNEKAKEYNTFIDSMAEQALRTLCIAYRDFGPNEFKFEPEAEPPETDLTLLAIIGIEDPLRPPVVASVADCRRAGIFVRMVTGDNIKTAKKIAEDCGILTPTGIAMEGPQFAKLTDEEVDDILPRLQVLARSSPQDKFKLVHRLRLNGEVVAVTGDGTNDALALKEADIGLAMGIAGTAVAKEASDIVILDDNFVSIVKAVIWGRGVFDNIRKFLQFQLTINFSALTIVVISALSNYGTPLRSIQLLWVNMIMDTLASLALCTEKPTRELLDRKPYGRKGRLLSNIMIRNILSHGLFQVAILLVLLYSADLWWNIPSGRRATIDTQHYTLIFNTFVWLQIFNIFNCRRVNDEKNVFQGVHRNWLFIVIVLGIIAVQIIIVQVGGVAFHCAPLTWDQWLVCIGLGFLSIPMGYVFRLIPVPKEDRKPKIKAKRKKHAKSENDAKSK